MTVIAWDGKTLAADRRADFNDVAYQVTKIFRVHDGLAGMSGNGGQGHEMLAWYERGAKPEEFPPKQRDKEEWCTFVVFNEKGIHLYERTPYPLPIEASHYACGSGRDYALAAMYLGKTAREAVEVACHFSLCCGDGIDELKW